MGTLDYGWILVSGTTAVAGLAAPSTSLKLAVVKTTWDDNWNPEITDYTGGGHYGFDLDENGLQFDCKQVMFKNAADRELARKAIRTWQLEGSLKLKLQKNTAGDLEVVDEYNTFPVMSFGPKKSNKVANEDGEVYEWGSISFKLSGTPTLV